jgi:antitoxin HicB
MKQEKDELQDFFEELGEWDDVVALARKKMLADDLRSAMKVRKVTPAEMARRMKTSRQAVYRLLDPQETGATLDTLSRASAALGMDLQIRLSPKRPQRAQVDRKGSHGQARRKIAK